MGSASKKEIIEALDLLPSESLEALAQFVEFLRAKAQTTGATVPANTVPMLGGLWAGYTFSEEDIDQARHETWAGLGKDP